jgi:hypothetical protein
VNKQPKGVGFDPRRKKNPYQSRIQIGRNYISLGSFPTAELAHQAYLAKRVQHPRPPRKPRNRELCSLEEAIELLQYDPSTGILTWRKDRAPSIKAGDRAGSINSHGYDQIIINGRAHLGHRLAWFLTHGRWPAAMIDHIDGDRWNNRLSNLREATSAQNQANRGARKDNKSGRRGVRFQKHSGKWAAQIQIGSFDTMEEASAAYLRMAGICYGEFAPKSQIHFESHAARRLRGLDRA